MRYPLIDIHGNNGNIAGDGAAAMRYTEARLSKLAEDGMLKDIKHNQVPFMPNYSEDAEEPVTLPSIFPNLLCNPNSGIGVAMACSWLPHNLNEVAEAIIAALDGKEPTLPGPDFPTGGIIVNKDDIPNIMATGRGSVKVQGKYKIEKNKIIFYEIPYGTTTEGLLNEISKVCDSKEIEGVSEIRDESNKKGLRLVIECNRGIEPQNLIIPLFRKTSLMTSISYNQVALVDKTPTELNLKDCINIYIKHNIQCLINRTKYELDKAEKRLEIVIGLIKAVDIIDKVIADIKSSESAAAAKQILISRYEFTEPQAAAILNMKLSSLAKLEANKLEKEKATLEETIGECNNILANESTQKDIIKAQLRELVKKYGDARRTELTQNELPTEKKEKEVKEIIPEDCVVILSQTGDIKRIPTSNFKIQKRKGFGVKTEGDAILATISTNTIDNLMLFTNTGKVYKLSVNDIPQSTNAGKGLLLNTLINLEPSEKVLTVSAIDNVVSEKYVIFVTQQGYVKKTKIEEYRSVKKKTGLQALKLNANDKIATVLFMDDEELILTTRKGMAIRFESSLINPIGRVAMGVKSIKLSENDYVMNAIKVTKDTTHIAIFTTKGYGKRIKLSEFPIQGRNGKGVMLGKEIEIAGSAAVKEDTNFLIIGKTNSICIAATELSEQSRLSQGVMVIKDGAAINKIITL